MAFEGFTEALGAIGVGPGGQVLPAPAIPASYNTTVRNYDDRTFAWNGVQANAVGMDEATGAIPIQSEVATYYTLEITPDLGWANKESLFQPHAGGGTGGNSRLIRIRNIALSELTSTVQLDGPADNKLEYTIADATFRNTVLPEFDIYLWRILAVKANGMEGYPSIIQRFTSKLISPNVDWSIDEIGDASGPIITYPAPVPNTSPGGGGGSNTTIGGTGKAVAAGARTAIPSSLTISLNGRKAPNVATIEINGVTRNTILHSPTRWAAEVRLTGLEKSVLVRAIDKIGNASSYKTITVSVPQDIAVLQPVWNVFDEHGLLLDLERIPAEDNVEYQDRILDVYKHRAGPRYRGLVNGITRELGLSAVDDALTLLPAVDSISGQRHEDVAVEISPTYIKIDSNQFIKQREHHAFDTWKWSVTLDEIPIDDSLIVEAPIGTEVKPKGNWVLDGQDVKFKHNKLLDTPIYVTYRYLKRYNTVDKTIADVRTFMTGNLLDVTTGAVAMTGEAKELALIPRSQVAEIRYRTYGGEISTGLPVRWSNLSLRRLDEEEFQLQHLNTYRNHFGTKVERHARYLESFIHTQWGFLIADKNLWSEEDKPQSGMTVLRTTYDPHLGHWQSSSAKRDVTYTTAQAYAYNYVSPFDGSDMIYVGVGSSLFKSGIGDKTDLLVKIINQEAIQVLRSTSEIIQVVRTESQEGLPDVAGTQIINVGNVGSPGCGTFSL
jgi:hypothetical protein